MTEDKSDIKNQRRKSRIVDIDPDPSPGTSIDAVLLEIKSLLGTEEAPYEPKITKINNKAYELYQEMLKTVAALKGGTNDNSPMGRIAAKLLNSFGRGVEEPRAENKKADIVIRGQEITISSLDGEKVRSALLRLKDLRKKLDSWEEEAYPRELNMDRYIKALDEIVINYEQLARHTLPKKQGAGHDEIRNEIQENISHLIEEVIHPVREMIRNPPSGNLTPDSYAKMISYKNQYRLIEATIMQQRTALNAQLEAEKKAREIKATRFKNEEIILKTKTQAQALTTIGEAIYALGSSNNLRDQLLDLLYDRNPTGLIGKPKFSEIYLELTPERGELSAASLQQVKEVDAAYQAIVRVIKEYQSQVNIPALDYLVPRSNVLYALNVPVPVDGTLYERVSRALHYDFTDLTSNTNKIAFMMKQLIQVDSLMAHDDSGVTLVAAKKLQEATAVIRDFAQKFPPIEAKTIDGTNCFIYGENHYPFFGEHTPFIITYLQNREKIIRATEQGDQVNKQTEKTYTKKEYVDIVQKLQTAKAELETYVKKVDRLKQLETSNQNLREDIQAKIASIPKQKSLATGDPQAQTNKIFNEDLSKLLAGVNQTGKALLPTLKNMKETAPATAAQTISSNESQFKALCKKYDEETQNNKRFQKCQGLIALKKPILEAQLNKISTIRTSIGDILSRITEEMERIKNKSNNNDPRLEILKKIYDNINHYQIGWVETTIHNLDKALSGVTEISKKQPDSYTFTEQDILTLSKCVSEDQAGLTLTCDKLIQNIKTTIADEQIEQLTLAKQHPIIAFINKHIIRPIVLAFNSPTSDLGPTFFMNESEVKMRIIRQQLQEAKKVGEEVTDENTLKSNNL